MRDKAQDVLRDGKDPLTERDPWLIQNSKGRTRPAASAPPKPTLACFFPEGSLSQVEKVEPNSNLAKDKEAQLDRIAELLDRESQGPVGGAWGCPVSELPTILGDPLELPKPSVFRFGSYECANPRESRFFGGPSGGM